ncbi:MAG: hypothetical protein IPN53_24830 [Comamonadaceae bacterium]|nr:hypothetical protein [Comamonadaceae bacterium]
MPINLSRLYQPRSPLFWLMLTLNLLSMVLGWVARSYSPGAVVSLVIVVFAIGNAILGIYLMWRLVKA